MPKNRYERRIDEQRAGTSSGGGFSVSGGGGGVSDHGSLSGLTDDDHTQYHNNTRGDARYPLLSAYNSHVADADAHHNQVHVITGSDHTVTGAQYDVVGLSATNTLGVLSSSSNGSAGNEILRTDVNGDVTVADLNATNAILSGDIDASTGTIDTLDGTTLTYTTINGTTGNITNVNSAITKATTRVDTPLITSLAGTTGGSLQLDGDTEIILGTTMKADTDIDGAPSLQLNPNTGLGDFEILQAKEAFFEALIAQVTWAEAGALRLTKSLAEVAQEFTVPAHITGASKGTATELIVNEFESLPGYDPIGGNRDDQIVRLHFLEPAGSVVTPVGFIGERMQYGDGAAGSSTTYANSSFESQTVGNTVSFYGFSGASNNTTVGSTSSPATVELDGSNKALFYDGGAVNAHIHYIGTGQASIEAETGIVFTGRFKRETASEGIGLLVADRYPTDTTDEYVRIRCYGSTGGNSTLHVNDHGQTVTPTGTTDSGYNPSANSWHRFKIQFDDGETTASTTTLKARFWADGSTEPETWQIDCTYTGAGRPTDGTVGMWLYNNAGVWYDDLRVDSLSGTSATTAEATLSVPNGVGDGDYLFAVVLTESTTATITKPTEFTLSTSGTHDTTFKYYIYYRAWTTGDPSVFTWSSNETERIYVTMYAFENVDAVPTVNVVSRIASDTPNPTTTFTATAGDMDCVVHFGTDTGIITGLSVPNGYTAGNNATDFGTYSSRITYRPLSLAGSYLPTFIADESDYLVLHVEWHAAASTSTDFAIGYVHGVVEKDTDQTGLDDGEVRYKWWTLPNQTTDHGRTVPIGSVALDYGTGQIANKQADSFIDMTSLDKTGSPYIRFGRMVTYSSTSEWWNNTAWNPTSGALNTQRVMQMGELKGLTGFDSDGEIGLTIDSDDGRRQIFSSKQMVLDGPDSTWKDGSEEYLTIDRENGIRILRNYENGQLKYQRGYSFIDNSEYEQGGVYGYSNAANDGSRAVTLLCNAQSNEAARVFATASAPSTGSSSQGLMFLQANGYITGDKSGQAVITLNSNASAKTDYSLVDISADYIELDAFKDVAVSGSTFTVSLTGATTLDTSAINAWDTSPGTLGSGVTEQAEMRAKRIGDLVFLSGEISDDSGAWTNGQVIYTLDSEFRPGRRVLQRLRIGSNHLNVQIATNGQITAQEALSSASYLVFDGIVISTA